MQPYPSHQPATLTTVLDLRLKLCQLAGAYDKQSTVNQTLLEKNSVSPGPSLKTGRQYPCHMASARLLSPLTGPSSAPSTLCVCIYTSTSGSGELGSDGDRFAGLLHRATSAVT